MRPIFFSILCWTAAAALCLTAGCSKKKKKKTTPTAGKAGARKTRPTGELRPEPAAEPRVAGRPGEPEARPAPGAEPSGTPAAPSGRPAPSGHAAPVARPRAPAVDPKILVRRNLAAAQAALRSRQYDRAVKLAKTVLALEEKNVPAMVVAALAYYRKGQIELCRAVLQFIEAIDPGNATGFYLAGHLALHDNEHSRAIKFFERAVEKNPNLPDAWSMLCVWYVQGKNWKETRSGRRGKDALTACAKAVNLNSTSYKSWLNLGTVYRGLASDCRTTAAARCDIRRQSCRAAGTAESSCQSQFTNCLRPAVRRCRQSEASYYKRAKDTYWKANAVYQRYLRRRGRPARLYPLALFNIGVLYLDAAAMPGETAISRLQKAKRYLNQFLRTVDPRQARKEQATIRALVRRADAKIQAVKAKAAAAAAAAAAKRAAARARGGR